jgi:hypothetical protein
MHRSILETGDPANQFAVFTPTKIEGLPESITIGTAFSFTITGTLEMHGASNEEITYGDWGIQILRLPPQVASVEDTTILKLEFVANAQ